MLAWVSVTDLGIPPKDAVPYSFGESAQLTTEKLALYLEAAGQMAIDMEASLTDWLPGLSVEATQLLEADSAGDLNIESELVDTSSTTLEGQSCGRVVTEAELALSLVTGLLGGSGMTVGEPRPLTTVEQRVLDLLTVSCLEAVAKTLLIEGEVSSTHDNDGSFVVGDDDSPEPSVAFDFRVAGPAGGGRLILSFDLWVLQRFSDAVDARLSGRQSVEAAGADPAARNALAAVPVDLVIELGRVTLTAREVVNLQPGDVVRTGLSVDQHPAATIDSIELFDVRLAQRGPRLTAEVLGPIRNTARLDGLFTEGGNQ